VKAGLKAKGRWLALVGCGWSLAGPGVGGGSLFAGDIVHFKDGNVIRVDVEEVTPDYVVFHEPGRGAGSQPEKRVVGRPTVHFIEFATESEKEALAGSGELGDIEALRHLWHERRPSIAMPDSRAGIAGLRFASVLMLSDSQDNYQVAFEVFRTIEERDWDLSRRADARRGRFNALLQLGHIDEAMREAEAAVADPDAADPTMLVTAWLMFGDLALKQLQELEEEHPRWMEDDSVRPERNMHFDKALDHYLSPFLYYGDHAEGAAEGLWNAVRVFAYAGEEEEAKRRAGDLVFYYPDTEAGVRGNEWLAERRAQEEADSAADSNGEGSAPLEDPTEIQTFQSAAERPEDQP